jgi:hypothetical protein
VDKLTVAFDKLDYQMLLLILAVGGEKGYTRGVGPLERTYVTPSDSVRLAVLVDCARRRQRIEPSRMVHGTGETSVKVGQRPNGLPKSSKNPGDLQRAPIVDSTSST